MGRPVNCASGNHAFLHDVARAARAVGRDGQVIAALAPSVIISQQRLRRRGG